MGVLTEFRMIDGSMTAEIEMPYPVRVGDEVEIYATGYNMTVASVAWIITQADEGRPKKVELLARLR